MKIVVNCCVVFWCFCVTTLSRMAGTVWEPSNFRHQETPYEMVSMRVPGFNFESFDRHGNPKLTSLMKTGLSARLYAFNKPLPRSGPRIEEGEKYFLDFTRLMEELFGFVSSTECIMHKDLYNQKIHKRPLDMTLCLINVGTHSFTFKSSFYACTDEQEKSRTIPLFSETFQIVTVNRTTRKKARLPEWYIAKYKGKGTTSQGLLIKTFERPAVTYAHPHVVHSSETDEYRHANYKSYPSWAVDALHAAIAHQSSTSNSQSSSPTRTKSLEDKAPTALHGIGEEIIARGLCKTQIIYLRECLEGECVEIHVWQNAREERELVYISIVKDGVDICQMKMWFFDSVQNKQEGNTVCKL